MFRTGFASGTVSEPKTMIFGFNTDIKHDDTVYHVQSEAREGEIGRAHV